jgi:hypothetical protein
LLLWRATFNLFFLDKKVAHALEAIEDHAGKNKALGLDFPVVIAL